MNSLIKFFMLVVLAKFTYSVEYAIENNLFHDVMEHKPVVFTCTHEGTIDIEEHSPQSTYMNIVKDSILVDDRFTYMNTTVDGELVHKITLKNATLDLHYTGYICYKSSEYCCVTRILIPQEQEEPSCITNYYTKTPSEPTRFECVLERVYPIADVNINVPSEVEIDNSTQKEYFYTRNETHVARTIEILGNVENITMFDCEVILTSYNMSDIKVCYYDPPITTTMLDDTIDSDEHNSGISIYGSVILVLVCLLIH